MGGVIIPIDEPVPLLVWYGGEAADRARGSNWHEVLYGLGGDDRLGGGDNTDTLYGGAGNDWLFGGAGDDRLHLGAGDQVWGGTGADLFMIEPGPGRAVVHDVQPGDRIDLSAFDLAFAAADPGLEDGFALWQVGDDLRLRLVDETGARLTIWLRDVQAADLTADDFLF